MPSSVCDRLRRIGLLTSLMVWPLAATATESSAPAKPAETGAVSDADVLLDLLLSKGVISKEDVEKARAEMARRSAAPAEAVKLKVADWIKAIDFYGDARLRFEYRAGEDDSGDHLERERGRYRLRFGANSQFTDHLKMGLRLETSTSPRSSNITFGDDSGPFGKDRDRINLGLLFLSWSPCEAFTATGGRQLNPLQTTSLIWDPDITPEGLSETVRHRLNDRLELSGTFGQFVYDDANPDNPIHSGGVSDAFLFANQVGARLGLTKDLAVQVAPTIYVYSGQGDSFRTVFTGATINPADSIGVNDLLVFAVPAELRWQAGRLPVRFFGEFAMNLEGADRARAAGDRAHDDEVYAYQLGVELGSARRKGGWSLRGFWQHAELYSLDPNLIDSDFFDGRLNMEGFVFTAAYGLTDSLMGVITYGRADRANKSLPGMAGLDLPGVVRLNDYQILQLDLHWRF